MAREIDRRESDLKKLREMLRSIVDSMPSVLVRVDPEGRVTQWNREARKQTGIEATEAIGRQVETVFLSLSEDMQNVKQAMQAYKQERHIPDMLAMIMESGQRAAQIVENMLSFSRKSEAAATLNDLGQLLDDTLALARNDYDLKKHYDFRQIEIVRKYDSTVPLVACEAPQIQQVFLNILKNGAQAMAQNADTASPRFVLRVRADGKYVRVEIEDNGPGMPPEVCKRIFEPFYTTKSVGVGTGLGLTVSYFIITENHGGRLTVVSAPGAGSRFIVLLPVGRDAAVRRSQ